MKIFKEHIGIFVLVVVILAMVIIGGIVRKAEQESEPVVKVYCGVLHYTQFDIAGEDGYIHVVSAEFTSQEEALLFYAFLVEEKP